MFSNCIDSHVRGRVSAGKGEQQAQEKRTFTGVSAAHPRISLVPGGFQPDYRFLLFQVSTVSRTNVDWSAHELIIVECKDCGYIFTPKNGRFYDKQGTCQESEKNDVESD